MRKTIIFLSLCIIGIGKGFAQDRCDTLKWKIINSYYCKYDGNTFNILGEFDNAIINMDSTPDFFSGMRIVNISNDTYSTDEGFSVTSYCFAYTDAGRADRFFYGNFYFNFPKQMNPNDTMSIGIPTNFNFNNMISAFENDGIEFEQITHWKMLHGFVRTSRDGTFSDSIIDLGTHSPIFYVTKTPVNIIEQENELASISIFPNPAQSQFTVTNTENASIYLYNLLGQKVKQIVSTEENTIIQTDNLPAGIYVLKVEKGNAVLSKKVQVIK